jgi:hypothetical protein
MTNEHVHFDEQSRRVMSSADDTAEGWLIRFCQDFAVNEMRALLMIADVSNVIGEAVGAELLKHPLWRRWFEARHGVNAAEGMEIIQEVVEHLGEGEHSTPNTQHSTLNGEHRTPGGAQSNAELPTLKGGLPAGRQQHVGGSVEPCSTAGAGVAATGRTLHSNSGGSVSAAAVLSGFKRALRLVRCSRGLKEKSDKLEYLIMALHWPDELDGVDNATDLARRLKVTKANANKYVNQFRDLFPPGMRVIPAMGGQRGEAARTKFTAKRFEQEKAKAGKA